MKNKNKISNIYMGKYIKKPKKEIINDNKIIYYACASCDKQFFKEIEKSNHEAMCEPTFIVTFL